MAAGPTLPDRALSEAEMRLARESSRSLVRVTRPDHPLRLTTTESDPETVEIPAAAAGLLVRLLSELARGNAVSLVPIRPELTTHEVADLLGVSQRFVEEEIEADRLPALNGPGHRRVRFDDLAAYKKRLDTDREEALGKLSAFDEYLGLK